MSNHPPFITAPFITALFISALTSLASITPSLAQGNPTNSQLTKQFRDGFLKGCLQGKTPGVRNQSSYCNCMAKSYQSRYDGRALTVISQLAGSVGEQGPALVNLMMTPEAKACSAKS
jgi:hypothetical protein